MNTAVPTRMVQTGGGQYYTFKRSTTVSVTGHESTETATEGSNPTGHGTGIKNAVTKTFTGTIRHESGLIGPNGTSTYPGYATVYPGGEILDYTLSMPFGMEVRSGGTGDTFITFGKDFPSSGTTPYRISITYTTGTYSYHTSGSWNHTLSSISISNEWCSNGAIAVSTSSTGYSVTITEMTSTSVDWSFRYSGTYTTTTTSYYGTGTITYYGDIVSVSTNFGSVSYTTRYGNTMTVNVSASGPGTALVTGTFGDYSSPTYTTYANARFTGQYANGASAVNAQVDYIYFNGERYP